MKVLLVDNYDSFVYNLKQLLGDQGAECQVVRNDAISLGQVKRMGPDAIVLSPGPGRPDNRRDFGICHDLLTELSSDVLTLGVCLGHQGIASTFGGKVVQAPVPMHGKVSEIVHDGEGLFQGLPNPMQVGRYHSLVATELPSQLIATAHSQDGLVMALRHKEHPIVGVQFHPESILTPCGKDVLANFMKMV